MSGYNRTAFTSLAHYYLCFFEYIGVYSVSLHPIIHTFTLISHPPSILSSADSQKMAMPPSQSCGLKVHKNENFFGFDFELCTVSLLVILKYEGFVTNHF
jgi:hypothetical protein